MEYVEKKTTKDKLCIFVLNYFYNFGRPNSTSIYWRCRKDGCKASVTTEKQRVMKINGVDLVDSERDEWPNILKKSHTCPGVSELEFEVNESIQKMRDKAPSTPESIYKIYRDEKEDFFDRLKDRYSFEQLSAAFPSLIEIQSCLYKHKSSKYPTLPKSIEDISIVSPFDMTKFGNEKFLLGDINVGNERIIIFGSPTALKILSKSERYHCDGTFQSAPSQFQQLCIVHGVYDGIMLPCIYSLMSGIQFIAFNKYAFLLFMKFNFKVI